MRSREHILGGSLAILVCLAIIGCRSERMEYSASFPASEVAEGPESASSGVDGAGEQGTGARKVPAGQLTAGEWRDLEHWDFWLGLFESSQQGLSSWAGFEKRWGVTTRGRYPVRVVVDAEPVIDARVELQDAERNVIWRGRTDNRGRAELYDGFLQAAHDGPFTIVASSGEHRVVLDDVSGPSGTEYVLELDSALDPERALDLMFMIDTTGSMGDELRYIQAEVGDVIDSARKMAGGSLDLRLSVNFYRDEGDEYVVRPFPFTNNISQALDDLSKQKAHGGGDYPEAVDKALENAIFEHAWSETATARLLFIVLDAPPHHRPDAIERLHRSVKTAAEKGVRIIAVMGSGYDRETEFLMRSYAIGTGGTFVFLTDDSGIGNPHLEPVVGQFKVEFLNALLTRVIASYITKAPVAP